MMGIYKIENLINGKKYIGQSTDIKNRWYRHKKYAEKQYTNDGKRYYQHLYNAMRKYGLNNFSFEVLEEVSEDKLNDREKYWINYYNSYENGYNNTRGGESGQKISQNEIDLICELWQNGYSISEIIAVVPYSNSTILKYLNNYEKTYTPEEGYKRGEKYKTKLFFEKNKNQAIDMFDLYNNYIGSFHLIRYACELYSLDDTAIRLCCIGKRFSTNGYRFSYHKQQLVFTAKRHSTTPLYKIDTNNLNKITYYNTIKEAAINNNCCEETIKHRLKDNKKTRTGLYWKYVDENYTPRINKYIFIDNDIFIKERITE